MKWIWFVMACVLLVVSGWSLIKSKTLATGRKANRWDMIGLAASLFALGFITVWAFVG